MSSTYKAEKKDALDAFFWTPATQAEHAAQANAPTEAHDGDKANRSMRSVVAASRKEAPTDIPLPSLVERQAYDRDMVLDEMSRPCLAFLRNS